jgi:hypothetical protein
LAGKQVSGKGLVTCNIGYNTYTDLILTTITEPKPVNGRWVQVDTISVKTVPTTVALDLWPLHLSTMAYLTFLFGYVT